MSNEFKKYSEEAEKYIGLTLSAAKKRAKKEKKIIRILEEDGKLFFGTYDWNLYRINLAIIKKKVIRAWIG